MCCTGEVRSIVVVLSLLLLGSACSRASGTSETDIRGVAVEDGQSNDHTEAAVSYDAHPPSGGDHYPVWLNCGVYTQPVPDELAVHSLEHGAVWFAYQPDLADDQVAALRALADERPDKVVVSPYPGIAAPVVAVAWERRLEVDDATDERLQAFLDAFVDGAQAPEPRAACTNGIDPSS